MTPTDQSSIILDQHAIDARKIKFHDANGNVTGELRHIDGIMTFTGNADASAQVFFDAVCRIFNGTN